LGKTNNFYTILKLNFLLTGNNLSNALFFRVALWMLLSDAGDQPAQSQFRLTQTYAETQHYHSELEAKQNASGLQRSIKVSISNVPEGDPSKVNVDSNCIMQVHANCQ
jgi:hypothetical protein